MKKVISKHAPFWGVLVTVGIVGVISVTQIYAGFSLQAPVTPDSASPSRAADEPQLPPINPRVPLEKIIDGTIVEVKGDYVVVNNSVRGLVTLHISPETRIWKGKWDNDLPIEVGDFFYGYGEPNGDRTVYEMEQMEINIVNLRGAVVSVEKVSEGLNLQLEECYEGKSYLVHITLETLVPKEGQEVPFAKAPFDLKAGDGVQIIGLRLKDGSVVATRVF